jgi:hypothetical protein
VAVWPRGDETVIQLQGVLATWIKETNGVRAATKSTLSTKPKTPEAGTPSAGNEASQVAGQLPGNHLVSGHGFADSRGE